jgi:hypothetical protein
LTGELPAFLSTFRGRTPSIGIFFDIFIGEHCLKGSPPIVEIEHIFDEKPFSLDSGQKEFLDPLSACPLSPLCLGEVQDDEHQSRACREPLTQGQPTSLKQLDQLAGIHPGDARCRRKSEHCLDLGMR